MYPGGAQAKRCTLYASWDDAFLYLILEHPGMKTSSARAKFAGTLAMLGVSDKDGSILLRLKTYRLSCGGQDWILPVLRRDANHVMFHRQFWFWALASANKRARKF